MNLGELGSRLSTGELSNLSLANEGNGTIKEDQKAKIINAANAGLLRIFSRFMLKQNDLIIELVGHITKYPLVSKYAELNSESTEKYKFIKDGLHRPFKDDVIKILEVIDYGGWEYTLNDSESHTSLFTPSPNVLQVPTPLSGKALNVIYQARHDPIPLDAADDFLIDIPFFLEEALTNYIGSLIYSHMNGQENMVKSQDFAAKYESICSEIEEKDLVNQTYSTSNTKFAKRGWI